MAYKKTQFIKDIKIGDKIDTYLAVKEKTLQNFSSPNRAGEQFLRVLLADASGTISGVVWDDAQSVNKLINNDDIIYIKGEVSNYKGPQVVIKNITKVDRSKIDSAYFQSVTKKNRQEIFEKIKTYIHNYIKNPYLKRMMLDFFDDHEFCRLYIKAPGGRLIHHGYVGGLLEHSLEVVEICLKITDLYPGGIDQDLLISGAILHDIGKIKEYDLNSISFQMTNQGRLLGHITLGREMVIERASKFDSFPEEMLLELEHMIISHHGKKEWGSPEGPKTMNAFALYYADLLSARLNQFEGLVNKNINSNNNWSDWDRFLERNIYIPDYLREDI